MMNYNEPKDVSSNADNQNPSGLQNEINEYLKQLASRNLPASQDVPRQELQNQEQGNSLLQNYLSNVCDAIIKQQNTSRNFIDEETGKFFGVEGRNEVMDYLKNSNVDFDKDEIKKISAIVEKLENSAVERYLKQKAREQMLQEENENAKMRLKANAQNANSYNPISSRTFTREQIGKMSSAEFAKNEKLIMDQLKKGLIR